MEDEMIKIPVNATYRIVDGKPIRIDAEYKEVSVRFLAEWLADLHRRHYPAEQEVTTCE